MSYILYAVISFFLHALALKMALGVMGQPASENRYSTALTVAGLVTLAGFALKLIPVFGWLLSPILLPLIWLGVVMGIYKIGFSRSLGVAVIQLVIRVGLFWILKLIGFSALTL